MIKFIHSVFVQSLGLLATGSSILFLASIFMGSQFIICGQNTAVFVFFLPIWLADLILSKPIRKKESAYRKEKVLDWFIILDLIKILGRE